MTDARLTAALADRYRIERELGAGGMATVGSMHEARVLVARGIAEHETYWQFAKSPAWAPFLADPEGAAMLRALGFCGGGTA